MPTAKPIPAPTATSVGKWRCDATRDHATTNAAGATTSPAAGAAAVAATAYATAPAVCDDGIDEDLGAGPRPGSPGRRR